MSFYVDVHTHLTHPDFAADLAELMARAKAGGMGAIVVNGLGPQSNREILQLAQSYPLIKAALGIYPIEAVNEILPKDFALRCERFTVKDELQFIEKMALAKQICAVGEVGLDGFHLGPETFALQEDVLSALIDIAKRADLPLIVHSRKREERVLEMLAAQACPKVNLHCYSGKIKSAVQAAEKWSWCFSIPANVNRSQSFQSLCQKLPAECLLTETDAPYLSPVPGTRNEPVNVVGTVQCIAQLRGWDREYAQQKIWENYVRLFDS